MGVKKDNSFQKRKLNDKLLKRKRNTEDNYINRQQLASIMVVINSSVQCLCVMVIGLVLLVDRQCQAVDNSPILFIPGIMGSKLNVKDNNPGCNTKGRYVDLWLESSRWIILNSCAQSEMELVYDPSTNSYHDKAGVTIQVPGFGDTTGVEFDLYPYFNDMVEYFVDRGYERGKSIRSAPYDWRLAADELEKRGYYNQLKKLVEEMYVQNGNRKVTIVVHSMGGLVSLHFLTGYSGIDQNWKDTYINAWVPLSAPWGGSVKAITLITSGINYIHFPKFLRLMFVKLLQIAKTFQSPLWLFPRASVFKDSVIISTPSKNYTAADYRQLFEDIGSKNGFNKFTKVRSIDANLPAPDVPTYCYYGKEVQTQEQITYETDLKHKNNVNLEPGIEMGNGDGTVNLVSLKVCQKWSSMSERYPFTYREYVGVSHVGIVQCRRVLADIAAIVRAPPPTSHISS